MGGELEDYIKKQLHAGYTRAEIESHLIRHGHHRADVERAFEKAVSKKAHLSGTIVEILSLAGLAVLIFWTGLTSDAPGISILAGFLPSILSIIFFISVVETGRHEKYLWAAPLFLTVIFLLLGTANISVFGAMEIYKLALMNIIISYIALVLISYPEAYRKAEHEEKPKEIRTIEHHFSSIEDKCKALNFVIGRVYRSSNGGTTKMRDDVRISNELYNEFDRAVKEGTKEDQISALDKVGKSLLRLQKTEKEIFGESAKHLKNIIRDDSGTSRAIDVLAKNDNDPVMIYYNSALEAYHEIRRQIEAR